MSRASRPVLFDLDGTLTDPEVGLVKAFRAAYAQDGIAPPPVEQLRQCIGPPLGECFRMMGVPEARVEPYINAYRTYYAVAGLFENRVYAGVVEMLNKVRASGRKLFVVTSKRQNTAERILVHFSLRDAFSGVFGHDHPGSDGTKTGLVKTLIEQDRFGALCAHLVGDRKFDIEAARGAGIQSVGVLWGFGSRPELEAAGADHLVTTPSEAGRLLTA